MNDLKIPRSPKVKRTPFKGSPEYNFIVLKYLKRKYSKSCVIIPKINVSMKDLKHTDVSLRWIQTSCKEGHFSIPKNYWDCFERCQSKRFIIFPFGFSCSNYKGHANYMIYDRSTRSLERFEPYGKTRRKCSNPKGLDSKIKKLFNENLGKDFIKHYYKPLDYLSRNSFQAIQESEDEMTKYDPPGGFCAAWSCWYAEVRLSNPDKNRKYIVKKALDDLMYKHESLTEYIRNYSAYIAKN